MRKRDQADELDALIEARRQGEPRAEAPASEPGRLAAAAVRLAASWQAAPAVDREAVRARIAAGIAAAPRRDSPRWWELYRSSGAWVVPRRAALATVAVIAAGVLFSLLATRSSSAAFVDDVERLSAVTTAALADDQLSDGEKTELASRAAALVERIAADRGVVASLEAEQLEAVAGALSEVESRLQAQSEAEAAPPPQEARPEDAPGDSPALDGAADAAPAAQPAPAVSESLVSVRTVSEVVEDVRASRAQGASVPPGHATLETVCEGPAGSAAGVCGAAVETAKEICGSVGDAASLDACSAAVEVATHNCDLLTGPDRSACRIALRDLERAAAGSLAPSEKNTSKGAGGENGRGGSGDE